MNFGILLRTPFQKLVDQIHEDLAREGYPEIRPAHGVVFQFIEEKGSRLTELAVKAQITKQSMTYLVEYLEKEGHIHRVADQTDKRATLCHLTDKGRQVVAIAAKSIERFEASCKKKMGQSKYKELVRLLIELNGLL